MKDMGPEETRSKILSLNRIQTWLIIFGTSIGIVTAFTAWAHGWLGLPDKVDQISRAQAVIELRQQSFETITNRVVSVEEWTRALNTKVGTDHDLLVRILQTQEDMKEQQQQLRQDVKDLKK